MTADGAGGGEVVIQRLAVIGVYAVIDNHPGTFPRGQAAQVGQTDFGHKDVDVMLGVVDVADHRHHAGNRPALGDRLGHKHREVCVTREVSGTTDAVHHPCAADVGGVDVAVDVELQRSVDADDAQTTHHFRMVGDLLRAQHQFVLVLLKIAEHITVAPL